MEMTAASLMVREFANLALRYVAILVLIYASAATAGVNSDVNPSSVKLSSESNKAHIVAAKTVHNELITMLMAIGHRQGLDQDQSMKIAQSVSASLLKEVSIGKVYPYLDEETLMTTSMPASDHVWYSVSDLLVSAMGEQPHHAILIDHLDELKTMPQTMPGSQILVVASDLGDLTPDRIHIVANSARALGIQINVIWVGESNTLPGTHKTHNNSHHKDHQPVNELTVLPAVTGGSYVDLSH